MHFPSLFLLFTWFSKNWPKFYILNHQRSIFHISFKSIIHKLYTSVAYMNVFPENQFCNLLKKRFGFFLSKLLFLAICLLSITYLCFILTFILYFSCLIFFKLCGIITINIKRSYWTGKILQQFPVSCQQNAKEMIFLISMFLGLNIPNLLYLHNSFLNNTAFLNVNPIK